MTVSGRPEWLAALVTSLAGRRSVSTAELEALLPVGLGLAEIERAVDEVAVRSVLFNADTGRPIGHHPGFELPAARVVAANKPGEPTRVRGEEQPEGPQPAGPPVPAPDEGDEARAGGLAGAVGAARLPPEDEKACLARMVAGDRQARELLFMAYLSKVNRLARRYAKAGAQREDLVQAGTEGLLNALAAWRAEGQDPFAALADRFIRRAMARHLAEERRAIRIPKTVDKGVRRLLAADSALTSRHSRAPTRRELAQELGVGEAEVAELQGYLEAPRSLDAPGEGGDGRLDELLADARSPAAAERAARQRLLGRVEELLEGLSVSHRRVVALRFGLPEGPPRTRKQVARMTGFDLDEVRRLEAEALAVLRAEPGLESTL